VTPQVLEILRNHNAKATFFCVGDNVSKHPEVYAQVLKEGHATGNHTFSHLKGNKTNDEHYFNDIDKCSELIKSPLFRPPHGRIKLSQIKHLKHKYKLIMWSVLTGDYNHKLSKEQVLSNAIRYTKDGSIIVFHDSLKASDRMLYALPRMLEHFTAKGYRFEKIAF
jgi:peptidoglycan/xylan/chitin deacetylase (PgdA/CDA1 family)